MTQKHALVIDDNSANVDVLGEMLTLEAVTYTKLQTPTKLAAVLGKESQIDVVFLDLEMPGLNGYEVFHMLRGDPHFADVPIVAYLVHVSEINTTRDLGFHSFLGKPLNADYFSEQLQHILSGEHVWSISSGY